MFRGTNVDCDSRAIIDLEAVCSDATDPAPQHPGVARYCAHRRGVKDSLAICANQMIDFGNTEPIAVVLERGKAVAYAAVHRAKGAADAVTRTAAHTANGVFGDLIDDRVVPLANVPALIERAVGALGVLVIPRLRPVIRVADRVARRANAIKKSRVVARVWIDEVIAWIRVVLSGIVPVTGIGSPTLPMHISQRVVQAARPFFITDLFRLLTACFAE